MLPTCIGISGVSRYRNDASIEDSFWASLIVPSRHNHAGAFGGASGVQTVLKSSGHGQDCAFSGGAYAMANGPDRSNWLNSPSAWANRAAPAHKAAALTPKPT